MVAESGVSPATQPRNRHPSDRVLDDAQNGGKWPSEVGEKAKIDFHHPYTPYSIQETFMQTVYDVLERGDGAVGILESPTGTGKSLSLICSTMTWLRDHKGHKLQQGLECHGDAEGSDEPDWVMEQARARRRMELLRQREDLAARLARVRAKEKAQKAKYLKSDGEVKRRKIEPLTSAEADGEDQFVLDDYDSDKGQDAGSTTTGLSAETLALMQKLGMVTTKRKDEDEDEVEDEVKIFYCSRTHSQLSQFINELRRVKIPAPAPSQDSPSSVGDIQLPDDFQHLTLGSRKNLCINPSVLRLNSNAAINERCLELQQPKTSSAHRCSFLPTPETQALVNDFRDHTLATVRDIEELASLGKQMGVCPYYAARAAIRPSEIVTLPYPLLLQRSAREALGIKLEGNVVVVDEAHNLMDAIAEMHGTSVTLDQLRTGRGQVAVYLQKFRNRLKGSNRVYIAQVVRLLDSVITYLEGVKGADGVVDSDELLTGKGVDQINLFKLLRYLQESKLARKVESYNTYKTEHETAPLTSGKDIRKEVKQKQEPTTPTLQHLQSLLSILTNPSKEGRLFFSVDRSVVPTTTTLKYLLLDPTHYFEPILSSARAVILAGGTMSPMEDYITHLLSTVSPNKITTLSCGHVIPRDNLLAWTLSKGPTGREFEFTFSKRHGSVGEEMVDELGRTILNLCKVIPDGVVVFFPSYAYLEMIVQRWLLVPPGPQSESLWQRLNARKSVFREAKDSAGIDDVLRQYASAIDAGKGGLLLSVVGGKLSEGINFSDRLGRCVVIVGLPFPNIASAEWKAKMSYIEDATVKRLEEARDHGGSISSPADIRTAGKVAAREFYENACMRAVNQSIGRAIRHRNDYAAIVMVDKRYGNERIRGKLPGWIREGMREKTDEKSFGELVGKASSFFRSKADRALNAG